VCESSQIAPEGAGISCERAVRRSARALAQGLGFRLSRVNGSHHIFVHPNVRELVNLQDVRGKAKAYQIRQLLRLVERYNLPVGGEE
jgi:predicted RNA binding protein YcfA (HicA-like mRNA interferase family)